MKTLIGSSLMAISLLMTIPEGAAEVYKCKTPKGVVYQGTPCMDGEQSKPMLTDSTADLSDARAFGERLRQREAMEEQERRLRQAQNDLRVAQYDRQQAEKKAREAGDQLRKSADHCNVTVVGGRTHEQCVYGKGANRSYTYLEDGVPSGYQYTN